MISSTLALHQLRLKFAPLFPCKPVLDLVAGVSRNYCFEARDAENQNLNH